MVDLVSDPGHGGFGLIFAGGKDPDTQVGAEITIKEVIAGSPAAAQGTASFLTISHGVLAPSFAFHATARTPGDVLSS